MKALKFPPANALLRNKEYLLVYLYRSCCLIFRERSGGQHQQNGRRSRRRHGRRQRQRQRNRRNRRNNQDDSWYFPDEQRENQEQEDNSEQSTRENLVTENQAWVQSLISRQAQPSRPTLSPLTQGNNHTIRWTDSNNTVTITQDRHVNVSNIRNSGNESDRNQNSENERPPLQRQTSRPAARQASRQSQRERVNMSSNPDVNFNLAQQLEDRNRALQQLTQAASQIQLAAAAAAANYAQFISTQNSITGGVLADSIFLSSFTTAPSAAYLVGFLVKYIVSRTLDFICESHLVFHFIA